MLFSQSTIALVAALLASSAVASPTPKPNQKRSFQVELVKRSDYLPDGPAALRKAYRKFGIIPTDIEFDALDFEPLNLAASIKVPQPDDGEAENGAVSATPVQNDVEYLAPVTIGGQKFVMNFDTGSADTWVFNNRLNNIDKQGRQVYNPVQSNTFEEIDGSTFNITYGDQSFAHGTVCKDTIDIGGATVEGQAIGLPNDVSDSFAEDEASDGLVGLAFTSINTMLPEQQKTFFDNVAPDLDEPVLTAQLLKGKPGSYEFGVVDNSKFLGDLVKIPVDASQGFWEIKSTQFAVGDGKQTVVTKGSETAIADTGTSLMLINDEIVTAYYDQVEGSVFAAATGGFIYPCATKLPDLYVSVGDTHLARIPGDVVNFATVGTNTTTGEDLCFGGIQSNAGSSLQIYGDVFFKALFVVFDQRGPSLGLAVHA
ncbi:hypothetical protein FQN54_003254 [Arachnomyces sp. PD_36]|nr:hypothetical protein FQN54_003254 [Arachnomyces sp. PD_36]